LNVVPWSFVRDFGGGGITSGAVHALDVVQWALKMDASGPLEVVAPESGLVPYVTLKYPGDVEVQILDDRLDRRHHAIPTGWDELTSLQPFGGLYIGQHGWIHVGREGYLRAHPAGILQDLPARGLRTDAVRDHHRNWLDCIRSRRRPHCDIAVGARSTIVAHLACIARWTGKPLKWDSAAEQFVDNDEANRLRRRALREPWRA
jgi:predicted dehydrogenase